MLGFFDVSKNVQTRIART